MAVTDRKQAFRHEILLVCKANQVQVTGELWLSLVLASELALVRICQRLHIHPPP